jgi:hypothetical protein
MGSGRPDNNNLDILTSWELTAINILLAVEPKVEFDVNAVQANMLALIQALDAGKLDPALQDKGFMEKTEALLLALLRGDHIDVANPYVFKARQAVFAAAQVIYNYAVAKGLWQIHPEIKSAKEGGE